MRSRNSRGFTLIEVIVAMTIMALITGIAFAGLSAGIDSWQRGTRKIQELDRRTSVERLIERQLPLATPGQLKGSGTELQFVSTYSLWNGPGDPMAVTYSFESGNLVYSETPLAKYTAGYPEAGLMQSLGNFANFHWGYLGKDALDHQAWLDQWNSNALPAVIRVEVDKDVMIIPMVNRQ
jgi:prepilin-type N-terminal cleavage/methylation domain-containing protein